ncbi:MAG TPA: ribosome silencing factor [Oxalicibacterium sp.]|uniref:ribosome silencing factor n=1 Tax=Oxalicibacterium sp. TaxID=2766525 RepID=UPI002B6BC8A9|nr:ribosome silencing factor [Oxalicibacterium sp.]HWU97008.1 ribosome silencing factor [Oxalicibacterium sp.]
MDIKKLQALVIDALEDVKAQDIQLFDTTHLTSLFDRIAVASGTSNRQTKALASSVRDKVKAAGGNIVSIEGEDTGEWVLVDLGDMIVHIMQPAIRAYYRLEEIWGEKEVKFGAAKRTSKRGNDEDAPKKTTGRHLAASQASLNDDEPKKPARKTAVKKSAVSAKSAAKKAPAKKAVGKTIKVAATKTAAAYKKEKAPAKKAAAKAPAKKVVAKRAPAKKSAD